MKPVKSPSRSNLVLSIITILMLIVGLAPVGLMQVARSIGIKTSAYKSLGEALPFLILGLLVLAVMGTAVFSKNKSYVKYSLWFLFSLAVLNLGGCASLWSELSTIN